MITGIIFACLIEQAVCKPLTKEFDTVQECLIDTTETIRELEDTPGMVFYALCDPDGEPV